MGSCPVVGLHELAQRKKLCVKGRIDMKIKASWVAFLPVAVGAILLHLYYLFFIGGEEILQPLFGEYSLLINKSTEPEIIAILAGVLLLFTLFFSLIDRRTAPYCEIKGSPLSGIFLIVSGLLLGLDSALGLMDMLAGDEKKILIMAIYVLSLITALIFAIVGMGLLVGFNIAKKIRAIMLLPTIWSAVNMVKAFISHRKEASSFAFFDMFVWVTLTLFLFNNAMVLCGVEIKNPVKSSFVWGLPFVLYAAVYVISEVNSSIAEVGAFDFKQLVPQLMIGALGVYALFMLFRLSSSMITKEQESELEEAAGEKPSKKKKKKKDEDDELDDEPEAAYGVGSTKYVTAEFEKIRMEKAAKKAQERTGALPQAQSDDDDEEGESLSTLDKIDQLIQELSDETEPKKSSKKKK